MAQPTKSHSGLLKKAFKSLGTIQHPRAVIVLCLLAGVLCMGCILRFSIGGSRSEGLVVQSRESGLEYSSQTPAESVKKVCVDVEGSVLSPGVYELAEGSRVDDAIKAAGGKTAEAASGTLNLARIISDGEQILVPSVTQSGADTATSQQGTESTSVSQSGSLVNINTADNTALEALPGIGAETAKKIIADRQGNGPFKKVEDIQRVSGIGERKFEQMKELICV